MRVLQVINSLGTGGAEKLLLESLPIYNGRGIEVDLMVLDGEDFPFMQRLKSLKSIKIYSLNSNSVYNPFSLFKIIPYLKKYDLVHVHIFPSLYWVCLAKIVSFSNVKLIFTEHSSNNRRISNSLYRIVDKFIYSKYNVIVSISKEVDAIIRKHLGKIKCKFEIIENGVNLSKIQSEIAYDRFEIGFSLTEFDILLIQVSRFDHPKDQKTLINSLKLLPDNVKLLLVGDGELRNQNEKLVADLNLEARVFFLGVRMDVPKLLKTADVVILSSHYEGLSISSIEGMASGKPFVASDVPGLSELVSGAGLLFPAGDAAVLAETIKSLIEDKEYASCIADKCVARSEKYDINVMVDKYIELYHELVNNHSN